MTDTRQDAYSWTGYSAEIQRGIEAVREILGASGPTSVEEVISRAMTETKLCRARVVNAVAELVDDREVQRVDDSLERVAAT